MTKGTVHKKEAIKWLVATAVESYATGFQARHEGEVDNPEGTLNMKIHNVFIAALGPDIQYYSALVRSLDSSLGNMLEKLAIQIAKLSYDVKSEVSGPLGPEQTAQIADLLEKYKRREIAPPTVPQYQILRTKPQDDGLAVKRHDSDYYLTDKETGEKFLIELKIGGDLDNKKARSEKEALLEQFAILSNTLPADEKINIRFATAYNRYGEDKPWKQERVRQFFADDELLIGCDFWNFVCKTDDGYQIALSVFQETFAKMKFKRSMPEVSLWNKMYKYQHSL